MEDFTETEDRESAPMEGTETGGIIEIDPLEVIETGKTEDIMETEQRVEMTDIIIMIETTEKEDEEMDFSIK